MNRVTEVIAAVLLLIFIAVAWMAFHFHGKAVQAGGKVEQLQSDNKLQASTIATQVFQFQRANAISTAASQYGITTDVATQGKEIEYRTILKSQPTCDLAVPAAIAGGLLDYTHRIRSGAMSADTGDADATGAGPTASGTLTYCQAVLWIDPLLAAIDKANNQLLAIRQLDEERNKP
ncbi:hypothetical protein F0336_19050 [Serratia liquefaciens]|uniref:hypothetical protein n=1 Tax=Serratia liquefaciens TaxID=614 RepID=UPI00101F4A44|nr:hypothetical protein [Serratia liquefaciens]QIC88429.1 hypothetical protein F0336_19050 [Serratia liquefaciens]RYM69486.1 hypothetical protein BSQ99_16995 [Serratia liquefaciens]